MWVKSCLPFNLPAQCASPDIFRFSMCGVCDWLKLIYAAMEKDTLEIVSVYTCDFSVLLLCGFS